MSIAAIALIVFLIAYALIATEKVNRIAVVLGGAALMVLVGATNSSRIFYSHETGIDWNVIFLLLGMMIIVSVIHKTGLFEYLSVLALKKAKGNPKLVFVFLLILIAVASALLDNVTTILLAVPMTLVAANYLKVNPLPFILGEIFVSNIGGAATVIGDPPNIIIASKAGIGFNEFATVMGPLSALVLVVTIPLLVLIFRKQLVNTNTDREALKNLQPKDFLKDSKLLTKSLVVLTLVIAGFTLQSVTQIEPSLVAMIGAGLLVLTSRIKPKDFTRDIEWETLIFFAGLFVMVGALVNTGVLEALSAFITNFIGNDQNLARNVTLVFSALISGIVDNIPYVASMTPVISQITSTLDSNSHTLWWALAAGADFGGNLTIIGASANVVAIGIAKANGYDISFWQFARVGIPVTLVSVIISFFYLAFH